MKSFPVCQSCGVPLTLENRGTNRDKTPSDDYCLNCFENGAFVDPSLTLHHLEVKLMEMADLHNELTLEEAQQIIRILPDLKRWKMSNI